MTKRTKSTSIEACHVYGTVRVSAAYGGARTRRPHKMPKKLTDPAHAKRPSPPYHAADFPGKLKEGNDHEQYVSKADSRGIYHWHKIVEGNAPEQYYAQFRPLPAKKYKFPRQKFVLLAKKLRKIGVIFKIIGWKNVSFFIDNAEYDMYEYVRKVKKLPPSERVFGVHNYAFGTEHQRFWSEVNGEFPIQHRIDKKTMPAAVAVFKEVFGDQFSWNGKYTKTFMIGLERR